MCRWWLVPISSWWCMHLFGCTSIGYILDWIEGSMGNKLGSRLILQRTAKSNFCVYWVQSFHPAFHYTEHLDKGLLVVWFQWLADWSFDQQLWRKKEIANMKIKFSAFFIVTLEIITCSCSKFWRKMLYICIKARIVIRSAMYYIFRLEADFKRLFYWITPLRKVNSS